MKPSIWVLVLLVATLAGCAGGDVDIDGDGMTNDEERIGWSVLVDFMHERRQYAVSSDSNLFDTDGDGLTDLQEFALKTDPNKKDTDEDGLTDCQEALHTVLEQCEAADWGGEGDGGYGTYPNRADSEPGASRYVRHMEFEDTTGTLDGAPQWGDGVSDGDEILGYEVERLDGTRHLVFTDALRHDTDGDALGDGEEVFLYRTEPLEQDTDGDRCDDGSDIFPRVAGERFDIGLQSFVWHGPPGETAEIRFTWLLADQLIFEDHYGETFQVEANVTLDLAALDLPTARPGCNYAPYAPEVMIAMLAEVVEESGARQLDFRSHTNPGNAHELMWDVREDVFSWRSGEPFDQTRPFTWTGDEGTLTFSPQVILAGE